MRVGNLTALALVRRAATFINPINCPGRLAAEYLNHAGRGGARSTLPKTTSAARGF
jgi:hypothetical protein